MGAYEFYLGEKILIVFADSIGGVFPDPGPMEEIRERIPEYLIATTLAITVTLIALNTLIAIMGDSFDFVYSNFVTFDYRIRVQLLLNLNEIYFWNRVEKAGQKVYLVVVQYVTQKGLESSEWAGKMKSIHQAIKSNVARAEKNIRNELAGVQKNIAEVIKENADIRKVLGDKIDKLMEMLFKQNET